jgi:hypothetical protein
MFDMLDNCLEGEDSWLVQNAAAFRQAGSILPKGPPGVTPRAMGDVRRA